MTSQSDSSTTAFHKEIRTMLGETDATSLAGSLGRFLAGAGICFGLGITLAVMLNLGLDISWIGWKIWFVAYLLIVVPPMVWYERRSRMAYLTEPVRTERPPSPNPAMHLLFGAPRALIEGLRGMRGQLTLTQEAVFDRATGLVLHLSQINGGIPIKELMVPPENMEVFTSAVDFLDRHDCIGKSTDGRSLWLNSTFRKKLNERRLRLPETHDA